jgi:rRNA maturation endonuclease Nob1
MKEKVIYVDDLTYDPIHDCGKVYSLPQCPACRSYPTYNVNPCPFCGQELEYPEDVAVDESEVEG